MYNTSSVSHHLTRLGICSSKLEGVSDIVSTLIPGLAISAVCHVIDKKLNNINQTINSDLVATRNSKCLVEVCASIAPTASSAISCLFWRIRLRASPKQYQPVQHHQCKCLQHPRRMRYHQSEVITQATTISLRSRAQVDLS